MSFLLGILYVLSAFAATGYSLSCTTCSSLESTACEGPSMTCLPDNVCGSTHVIATAFGVPVINQFTMSCVPRYHCNGTGSISNSVSKIKVGVSCCHTDNCTSPIPTLPEDSIELNGIVCPSCSVVGSLSCDSTDTVQCTGDENLCVSQATEVTGNTTSRTLFLGCATRSYCDIGTISTTTSNVTVDIRITCTNGTSGTY
ncbi:hypothetical protein GDO86_012181 [Hymenochirus boettgeri]|uniref:UPAR/Ly6 domain-containing protein n=1 Tax=Hymenochirus boettgeri TaxID=247094 RepID=A0A8T2IU83_9PIPI|nr:hypothetical protein GDO86_012181 [Hymenochirus boettgeri]